MGSSDCSYPREHYFINRHTREWQRAPCETLQCFACRREAVRKRAGAITLAVPEKFMVITNVDGEWIKFAKNRRRFERGLELRGYDLGEWCVTLEVNRAPGMHHANLLRRGDDIPGDVLSELAERSGFGPVISDEPVIHGPALSRYVLKDAIDNETAGEFLASNAERLTHHSRGFFLDGNGASITAREAEEMAVMVGLTCLP